MKKPPKNSELDTYWMKEKRETRNKMERRRTQSDGTMWSPRWRLGGQTSFEIGGRKTLPYVIERLLHTTVENYVDSSSFFHPSVRN
jgi:hypothetical protein